ncbi:MAG: ParB/RepB/Spo0J family partition protein [Pseudomonadota bacterium]
MADENSKKRLGRGLAALMGELDQPISPGSVSQPEKAIDPKGERAVPIETIRANPNNPRRIFSVAELEDLSNSIAEHGMVQPILVRPIKNEDLAGATYEIIAGERRWRAAQRARLHEVPIIIRDVEDKQALELAIIENVQRADLNALEEAQGYQKLIDEYDYSQTELAQVIGKSRSHVANTLRLMKLPEPVQTMVMDGSLSAGHARALITCENPESLARKIVSEGLSVRQAETFAQPKEETSRQSGSSGSASAAKTTDIRALENQLESHLGLKVDLRHKDNNRGEMRIKYKSLDQLDEICRRLQNGL